MEWGVRKGIIAVDSKEGPVLMGFTVNINIGVQYVINGGMERTSAGKEEIIHGKTPMTLTEIDRTSTQTRVIGSITTTIEVQVRTR